MEYKIGSTVEVIRPGAHYSQAVSLAESLGLTNYDWKMARHGALMYREGEQFKVVAQKGDNLGIEDKDGIQYCIGEEGVKLVAVPVPRFFTFRHPSTTTLYTATIQKDGSAEVRWDGDTYGQKYSAFAVQSNLMDGTWYDITEIPDPNAFNFGMIEAFDRVSTKYGMFIVVVDKEGNKVLVGDEGGFAIEAEVDPEAVLAIYDRPKYVTDYFCFTELGDLKKEFPAKKIMQLTKKRDEFVSERNTIVAAIKALDEQIEELKELV